MIPLEFIGIKLGKEAKVPTILESLEKTMTDYFDKGFILPQYASGFRYVVDLLKMYWVVCSTEQVLDLPQLETMVQTCESLHFGGLSDQGRVAVLCAKQFFFGQINRKGHDEQVQILRQVS